MRLREFLSEADEKKQDQAMRRIAVKKPKGDSDDWDRYIDTLLKKKEQRMKQSEREKYWATKPGLIGTIAKGIQRGSKLYRKLKPLATRKIPFAE